MIERGTIIQLICVGIFSICLFASGMMSTALTAEAGRAQLVYSDEAEEGDPPEVALGIALGAFRGIFVNYLWIRANRLKEDGKFYEAIELSEMITRLQPRFPRVWVFHAWNMSYNISVATSTASERWQWVRAGINLLRNEAIPRNPNDVLLHKELAWLFYHKIQGWSDDANHYYKKQLAREWTIILGPPPENEGSDGYVDQRESLVLWLTPILESPETIRGVIREELKDLQDLGDESPVSLVRELVGRIENEANLELGLDLLRLYEMRRAFNEAWYKDDAAFSLAEDDRNAVFDELITDERYADAWGRLLAQVRRRVLVDECNMEPARMIDYTRRFGPLDWRHACTHSLYWATRGVEEAADRTLRDNFNSVNTDRTAMHSVQELWRTGDVEYDLITDEYFTLPNYAFTDTYGEILEVVRARAREEDRGVDAEYRHYTLYSEGYENFLKDVVRVFYRRGWFGLAEKYHQQLRTADWINLNDPQERLRYGTMSLEEFVEYELTKDRISIPHVAVSEIESALFDGFLEGLYKGNIKHFQRNLIYAKRVWDGFTKEQGTRTIDRKSVV